MLREKSFNEYTKRFLSAAMLLMAASPLLGQIANPIPGSVNFGPITLELEEFAQIPASASSAPRARINHLKPAGDGSGRLFVNDLRGELFVLVDGTPSVYLDLAGEISAAVDSPGLGTGFTSFAFHPNFSDNGVFYTAHHEAAGAATPDFPVPVDGSPLALQGVLVEWTATDPTANTFSGTRRELMRVDLVNTIHGMQEIAFNPNSSAEDEDFGMLYVCIGDSGTTIRGFPGNAHRLDSVLGTILRIDPMGDSSVNGNYGIPATNPWAADNDENTFGEIWAYGFRNPHRISWDTGGSGIMLCGDIGERNVEELNLIEPGNDYGWNVREGTFVINPEFENNPSAGSGDEVFELPADDDQLGFTYPVAQYDHDEGAAIVSGFVYRGTDAPALEGKFLFGDITSGKLYLVDVGDLELGMQADIEEARVKVEGSNTTLLNLVDDSRVDLRFGFDEDRELYLLEKRGGMIYRLLGAEDSSVGGGPIVDEGNLVNLATRGFVGSGDEQLIGGFSVDETTTVLVRAAGPAIAIAPFNVPGTIADPQMSLLAAGETEAIAMNDNWGEGEGAADVAAAISSTGAFAFPEGSADAALVATVEPGTYTVLVSGADGGEGVAIIEVYTIVDGAEN